jgi:hypothetical protein
MKKEGIAHGPACYETGPCGPLLPLSSEYSAPSSRGDLRFDDATDQTLRPFDEG